MTQPEEKARPQKNTGMSPKFQWIFYIMAIASLGGMILIGQQNIQQNRCQDKYAEASYKATRARTQAAEARQRALSELWANFLTVKTPAESRKLIENYLKAANKEIEERAKNPLPDPPSEFCREED